MPDPEVIDPARPTPTQNGQQHYEMPGETVGMTPQQIIKLIFAQGFAGWKTPIILTRPTQHGPEKYETTPAQLMAENTRAQLALNHTLLAFLQGAVPCEVEDEQGNVGVEEVNPVQALVDLASAVGESCDLASKQMGRKKRRR